MNNITTADLSAMTHSGLVVLSRESLNRALSVIATLHARSTGVNARLLLTAADSLKPVVSMM